jgi:Tat protein secretion system quality control protein TatD with DNase activity
MVKDRSEPCNIVSVFEVVATVRGETDLEKFSNQIYVNTIELFFNIK